MDDLRVLKKKFADSKRMNSYWTSIRKPIKVNAFLLEAGQGKNANGNIFALMNYLRHTAEYDNYEIYLSIEPSVIKSARKKLAYYHIDNIKFVERNSEEYREILATAKYLITDNSFPPYFYKREEQVYVNTWHGTPLKNLGRSDLENATSLANVQANMLKSDYLMHPNPYTKDIMMRDYMVDRLFKHKTIIMDYPRNDALFAEAFKNEILDKYNLKGKKLIAYMPTWRGSGRVANIAEQIEDVNSTIEGISSSLKENEILCVNLHFLIGNNIDISKYRNTMMFPSEYETYDFLAVCDTLITDYSSVCIDFAQTGKEVILYMYDYEEYKSNKGFYFDIRTLPFAQTYTMDELIAALHAVPIKYELDSKFTCQTKGNCCEKLINLMVHGDETDLKIEDYNRPNATQLVYIENILKPESVALLNLYLNSISDEEKENTVIAFENRINDEVVASIRKLDNRIDVIRIEHNAYKGIRDSIATFSYNRWSLFKNLAHKFYEREGRRLIDILNINKLVVLQLRNFDRVFTLSHTQASSCLYVYPTFFYGSNGPLFNKRQKHFDYIKSLFNETKTFDNQDLLGAWKDTICDGARAILSRSKYNVVGNNLVISGHLSIETELDFELSDKVVVCDREYELKLTDVKSNFNGAIKKVSGKMSISIPLVDMESFLKQNRFLCTLKSAAGDLKLEIRYSDLRKRFSVVKIPLAAQNLDCFIKLNKKHLTLQIRESNYTDAMSERIKLNIAQLCHVITPWYKPILLFEKESSRYEESGAAVYERLIDNGYKNAYFILDRNYDHYDAIPEKYRKNIIDRFSFKHYYNLFAAKSLISSEMIAHSLELNTSSKVFWDKVVNGNKNYVFLQHGVMYMVSLSSESRTFFQKMDKTGKERIVVSSGLEAKHFTGYTAYMDEELYVCGLPKFDKNILRDDADLITVMLTWRPWEYVSAVKNFEQTKYYKMLERIIDAIPDKYKDKVVVLPHPRFAELANTSSKQGVWQYSAQGVRYEDILQRTKILITDYSSISYDAFYRGSNVLFCWGEKDECMKAYGTGTKLMLTEDLAFGPVLYDENVSNAVTELYNSGQDEQYVNNYRKIVEFHDGHNTDRVIEMMKRDGII